MGRMGGLHVGLVPCKSARFRIGPGKLTGGAGQAAVDVQEMLAGFVQVQMDLGHLANGAADQLYGTEQIAALVNIALVAALQDVEHPVITVSA
ncbi:hypothetical protein D3C75_540340 [compost metagenome]